MSNASPSPVQNRTMFWRIVRRLITANRGRLFVILLALAAGAAITAALLNLQIDARRRLTTEFRAFGANAIITSRDSEGIPGNSKTFAETAFERVPSENQGARVTKGAFLYSVADTALDREGKRLGSTRAVVLTGYRWEGEGMDSLAPSRQIEGQNTVILDARTCEVGQQVAAAFHLHVGDALEFTVGGNQDSCVVSEVKSFGGPEDGQVFLSLEDMQRLANLPGQISLIQVNVPGTPRSIDRYIADVAKEVPGVSVHPVREFADAQAKIYDRVSGLLTATVVLVLILTALCVMAAMTNVAMERRNDVGLMKAIGGATRRVLRLFLT
ncbi:MAG TPA: hypothetical protein VKG25_24280, partial [Bryobacteraceae bacterium]|nr:hypothetical protein [Bryobacteraceae bacterium]